MKNKLIFLLVLFAIIHSVVAGVFFHASKQPLIFMAIVIGVSIIGFGSYLALLKPKSDAEGSVQQYVIATTVQVLSALAFVVFAKFTTSTAFKPIAFHFLAAFIGCLVIQSVVLINHLNRK